MCIETRSKMGLRASLKFTVAQGRPPKLKIKIRSESIIGKYYQILLYLRVMWKYKSKIKKVAIVEDSKLIAS